MQADAASTRKRRVLLVFSILVMLILIGMIFRHVWLSDQRTATLSNQLATERVAYSKAQASSEQALKQVDISRSRELAAQSEATDNRDAALKVLLAVESLKALNGVDTSNHHPSWIQQSFYDSLGNIGGLPLTGQQGGVTSLAFSPDGKWLASESSDATIFLRNMQDLSAEPVVLRLDMSLASFSRLTFSSDGKWLAVGSIKSTDKNIVLIWNMENLSLPPVTLLGNQGWVISLAFSPDGRWLAVANPYNAALLWDMQDLSAQPITLRRSASSRSQSVAFSLDGKWLAVGDYEQCTLWDAQNLSATPLVLDNCGGSLTFSPDGKWLAATSGSTIRLWNMKSPASGSIILTGHSSDVARLAFSADGKWLASAGAWDCTYRLWDMNNPSADSIALVGCDPSYYSVPFGPRGLAFSPDGKQLATADDVGGLRLWDVQNPSTTPKFLRGHVGSITCLAFSPDGKTLATGSFDMTVRLWDTRHPSVESSPLQGNDEPGGPVQFSPNGKWLAMSGEDKTVRVWDIQTPTAVPIVLMGFETQTPKTIFSQDNNWLVTTGTRIRLWKTQNLTANPIVLGEKDELYYYVAALSPDTKWLAAKPADKPIRLWNMEKLSEPPILLTYESSKHLFWSDVFDLTFSPDGKWLAGACGDELVRIWNMQSPKSPPITLPGVGFSELAFSSDSKWLATKSAGDEITRLWNVQNPSAGPIVLPKTGSSYELLAFSPDGKWFAQEYQPYHPNFFIALWDMQHPTSKFNLLLTMNKSEIRTLVFSPSGKWLAANSSDEAIYLWDMQNLKSAPLLLHGYGRDTFALAFSPDEHWLATIGKENSVRLWQLNLNELADRACQYAGRNLTRAEWGRYSFEDPYRATCPEWPVEPEPTPAP